MQTVFLDSAEGALALTASRRVIAARTPETVPAALDELQTALAQGNIAAGFFAYELGFLLDPATAYLLPERRNLPLLWFAVAPAMERIANPDAWLAANAAGPYKRGDIETNLDRDAYIRRCRAIIDHIYAGNIYQANLTFRARFDFAGSAAAFYADLRKRQPTQWGGFIETPDFSILSLSPEMFVECAGGRIASRPMKGTAPRGQTPAEDDALKSFLTTDSKSRAENLMIVDLMRNDLGRVAETGSVRAQNLFAVETHPTLHQMTSDVTATLRRDATLREILAALFPPGSVTGAPKLKAMQILANLETAPRGAYCGAVGTLGPGNAMRLNVGIRTITVQDGRGEIGIGSGVVADSDPAAEYDECLLKMRFMQ